MDGKKQNIENELKLNIYPFSTEETLMLKLNSPQKIEKLILLLIGNDNYPSIFSKLKENLINHEELNELNLSFDTLHDFDFEMSIYQLKDLKQIRNLTLQFQSQVLMNTLQSQTLGTFLYEFANLTSLSLMFNSKNLNQVDQFFSLNSAYSNLRNLNALKLQLYDFEEGSTIVYSIVDGIKQLKNLEKFKISVLYRIRSSYIIECLEQELKELHNIKNVGFIFGWYSKLTYHDFWNIGNILKNLALLEKCKINAFYSYRNKNIQKIGLEDSIKNLKQLKTLKIQINGETEINILQLLDSISLNSSLEKVELDFSFSTLSFIEDDISQLGKYLAKIPQLMQLKLEFTYPLKIQIQELLNLLSELKPVKKLEELSIEVKQLETRSYDVEGVDLDILKEVVKNIKIFHFIAYEVINQEAQQLCGDLIVNLIKQSESIEDLQYEVGTFYDDDNAQNFQNLQIQDLLVKKRNLHTINLLIGYLTTIKERDLNDFVNELPKNPKLTSITLEFNNQFNYSFETMNSLSKSIMQLQLLKNLVIQFGVTNHIDDEGFQILCGALQMLQNLEELSITIFKDKLKPETLNSFVSSFGGLKKMKNLTLKIVGSNFDSDEEEKKFGNSFKLSPKTEFFNINFEIPNLKYSNLEMLFKEISQMNKLNYFYLIFKFLVVNLQEVIQIKEYFSKLQILTGMSFYGFSINLLYLLNLFQDIKTLENIDLQNKYTSGLYSKVIAKRKLKYKKDHSQQNLFLQKQIYLKENIKQTYSLNFRNDYLISQNNPSDSIQNIPFLFESIQFLNKFKLYINKDNQIGNEAALSLFMNIRKLKNLNSLKLGIDKCNQIGTENIVMLSQSLTMLPSLNKLTIQMQLIDNQIYLFEQNKFFDNLGSLTQLEYLEFSIFFEIPNPNDHQNEIVMSLYKSIANMKHLQQLKFNLSNNGDVHESSFLELREMFAQIKNTLKTLTLYIGHNSYQTLIPQSLSQLKNLQYLELQIEANITPLLKLKRLVQVKLSENYEHEFFY